MRSAARDRRSCSFPLRRGWRGRRWRAGGRRARWRRRPTIGPDRYRSRRSTTQHRATRSQRWPRTRLRRQPRGETRLLPRPSRPGAGPRATGTTGQSRRHRCPHGRGAAVRAGHDAAGGSRGPTRGLPPSGPLDRAERERAPIRRRGRSAVGGRPRTAEPGRRRRRTWRRYGDGWRGPYADPRIAGRAVLSPPAPGTRRCQPEPTIDDPRLRTLRRTSRERALG
jgi:hypothetical protein